MYEPKNYFILAEVHGKYQVVEADLTYTKANQLMEELYCPLMDRYPLNPVNYFMAEVDPIGPKPESNKKDCLIIQDIGGYEYNVLDKNLTKEEAEQEMYAEYYPLMDKYPADPIGYYIVRMTF